MVISNNLCEIGFDGFVELVDKVANLAATI